MFLEFSWMQSFTEFSIVQRYIVFVDNTITSSQSSTFILDVFPKYMAWKKRINRRPDQIESQASVHFSRPKSSVKLYSSSVERNDACPIAITSFHKISCFREWFLFPLNTKPMLSNIFFLLEWYWSYHELVWTFLHIFIPFTYNCFHRCCHTSH